MLWKPGSYGLMGHLTCMQTLPLNLWWSGARYCLHIVVLNLQHELKWLQVSLIWNNFSLYIVTATNYTATTAQMIKLKWLLSLGTIQFLQLGPIYYHPYTNTTAPCNQSQRIQISAALIKWWLLMTNLSLFMTVCHYSHYLSLFALFVQFPLF